MKKPIQFRLELEQIEKAESVLIKFETLTDLVREAIDKEIERRQKEAEPS